MNELDSLIPKIKRNLKFDKPGVLLSGPGFCVEKSMADTRKKAIVVVTSDKAARRSSCLRRLRAPQWKSAPPAIWNNSATITPPNVLLVADHRAELRGSALPEFSRPVRPQSSTRKSVPMSRLPGRRTARSITSPPPVPLNPALGKIPNDLPREARMPAGQRWSSLFPVLNTNSR